MDDVHEKEGRYKYSEKDQIYEACFNNKTIFPGIDRDSLLYSTKPLLPQPMQTYFHFDPWEQTSVKFESNTILYIQANFKISSAKWRPFCLSFNVVIGVRFSPRLSDALRCGSSQAAICQPPDSSLLRQQPGERVQPPWTEQSASV